MPATARLRKRSDFVAARKGRRVESVGFTLQSVLAADGGTDIAAIGYTVTKKIGNAVVRNRIRRRLREAVRLSGCDALQAGHRYVLVARREVLALPFERLMSDLEQTATRVHAPRGPRDQKRPREPKNNPQHAKATQSRSSLPDDSRQPDRTR